MKRNQPAKFISREHAKKKRVRKLSENWTPERTRNLIKAVQRREEVWNVLCRDYKNRNLRESLWHEVARELGMSRLEVTTKWNNLRCSFRTSFNKMEAIKSGKGAAQTAVCTHYSALNFLEPVMRNETKPKSNRTKERERSLSSSNTLPEPDPLLEFEELQPKPSTSAVKRRQNNNDDAQYKLVLDCAMKAMTAATKTDIWDDLGSYVASSGREWASNDARLANEYKIAINEVVLEFQKTFLRFKHSAPVYNAAIQNSAPTDHLATLKSDMDKCIEQIECLHKESIEIKEESSHFED